MDQPSKWQYYLYLVGFAYNNIRYHASLKMSPFEALYGLQYSNHLRQSNRKNNNWVRIGQENGKVDCKGQAKYKDIR